MIGGDKNPMESTSYENKLACDRIGCSIGAYEAVAVGCSCQLQQCDPAVEFERESGIHEKLRIRPGLHHSGRKRKQSIFVDSCETDASPILHDTEYWLLYVLCFAKNRQRIGSTCVICHLG